MLDAFFTIQDPPKKKTLLEEIYEGYGKQMYFVAFRILQDEWAAEDAVQMALLGICKNQARLRDLDPERVRGYVLVAVRNAAFTIYQRERRIRSHEISCEELEQYPQEEKREADDVLMRIVASLPVIYRDILLLRYVYDMDHKQIAAAFGISNGAARQRLRRARGALMDKCKEEGILP